LKGSGGISGENHYGQYQQELEAPRHLHRCPLPNGIAGGEAMDCLALSFQPQRTPDASRFVGLSTRTLENYRYKGQAIVELMLNPDGPL
jgi:hypothetical protein